MNLRAAAVTVLALCGCQPQIGDHCAQSTDCSSAGGRLCDTSQPNGYCTIFNCRPNACPGEAACVATNISVLGCPYDDRHSPSRTSRQLCLRKCHATDDAGTSGDCRMDEGYRCVTPADIGIQILDTDQGEQVCLPSTSYSKPDAGTAPVCSVSGPTVAPLEAGPGWQGEDAGAADAADDAADAADDAPADALSE